jgi:hypothetical protein
MVELPPGNLKIQLRRSQRTPHRFSLSAVSTREDLAFRQALGLFSTFRSPLQKFVCLQTKGKAAESNFPATARAKADWAFTNHRVLSVAIRPTGWIDWRAFCYL